MPHLPAAETIPADRRTRRRLEWQDTRRPAWVMWLSVACVVALVVTVIALSNSDRMSRPTAVNGDALGPETGESLDVYAGRAAATLEPGADTGSGDAARWALVTPGRPLDTAGLTALFAPTAAVSDLRVSTLLVGGVQWAVPEPATGRRREDVFAAVRAQAAVSAGVPVTDASLSVTGVLVHAPAPVLRDLSDAPGVRMVEALPPDAVYGRFGVRPAFPAPEGEPPAPADRDAGDVRQDSDPAPEGGAA